MKLAWKTKKSAGVRVEPRVYRLIKQGDAARDARRWAEAVEAYRAAVTLDSQLAHIHLQLGHALKEINRIEEADAAYSEAAKLRPNDIEPLLQRAHLAKLVDWRLAAGHLAAILLKQSYHPEAQRELESLLGSFGPIPYDQLGAFIDYVDTYATARRETAAMKMSTEPLGVRPLVFDLTNLVGHFRHERLPNGIQRVQMEVLAALLDQRDANAISACCFINGRDYWIEVPIALCRDLIRLAGADSDVNDPEWIAARTRLFMHLTFADHYVLPWRAVLVDLGVSFWVHDHYRFIRNAKAERQIRYIPLIYDLIPLIRPEFCVRGWLQDFTIWAVGLYQHADGFLAISEATKRDVLKIAAELGHELATDRIEVVPLDADFRREVAALPASALDQWDLADTPFALLVSTIEPRKNHALALDGWAELLRRHGADKMPKLVFAGRDGWMNDDVFDRLDTDSLLAAQVTMIHNVSDADLALLHRACRFTLFPSLYEGWGLPVTESLCHGRVPVIADNSSLPEAGAGFALMFASGSVEDFARAVEKAAFDDGWRSAQEAKIAAEFAPRSWAEIAEQIESGQARLLADAPEPAPPLAKPGFYYPVSLYKGPGIWPGLASGEIFRVGEGWEWPETNGSRTRPEGGTLRMRIAGDAPMRLYLHLRGLESAACPAKATVDGVTVGTMTVRQRKAGWMACDLPAGSGPVLDILVQGALTEIVGLDEGGVRKERAVSIAVVGFFLCARDDVAANAAFIETRRGKLEAINAYRPPASSR